MQTHCPRFVPTRARGRRSPAAAGPALAAALALTSACAADPRRDGLSPHEFASVEHIAVLRVGEAPEHRFQVLDRVDGVSCNLSPTPRNHPAHKVVTEYEALYDLKLEAADLGANAVLDVACRRYGPDYRCHQSIVCEGDAVRLDDGVGMDLPIASMSALEAKAAGEHFPGDPALYESLIGFTPDYLTEAQRARLGTTGVAVPSRAPRHTVETPPSGDAALYQGAGLWFVQCAQGGTIGLMVAPLCAAIGAGLGSLSAETTENVMTSTFAIRGVLREYYNHDTLRERVARAAAQSGAGNLVMSTNQDSGPADGDAWRFDVPVDSVIEVGLEELLLPAWRSGATSNLPTPVSVRARVRVVRLPEGEVIYNRSYGFVSDRKLFREWGAENGAALRHALEAGLEQMAERIVDDLLLAYPLMPGFALAGAGTDRRNYVVEPLDPTAHHYWRAGPATAIPVSTLEPMFRWRAFPGEKVLEADFQRKLHQLSMLRYDLRIYRLENERRRARMVIERNNIPATEYALTQPLAPGAEYVWSVRARFMLDTGERTTRWSGDWVGGNVRGFLFRTPD